MPIEKHIESRLDHSAAIAGRWQLVRRRHRYVILDPVPAEMRKALSRRAPDLVRLASDETGYLPGVFAEDEDESARREIDDQYEYDAGHAVREIFTDATRIDLSHGSILEFVNRWGLLGLAPGLSFEPVSEVKFELRRLRRLSRWLKALKNGHWKSRDIPAYAALEKVRPSDRVNYHVARFARKFEEASSQANIHPTLHPPRRPAVSGKGSRARFELYFQPRRLLDVLYWELSRIAADPEQVLRRCAACDGLFPVRWSNKLKAHCDTTCKNRRSYRRWYARPKNRKSVRTRRAERRKASSVTLGAADDSRGLATTRGQSPLIGYREG
jgi:hypothetical protein